MKSTRKATYHTLKGGNTLLKKVLDSCAKVDYIKSIYSNAAFSIIAMSSHEEGPIMGNFWVSLKGESDERVPRKWKNLVSRWESNYNRLSTVKQKVAMLLRIRDKLIITGLLDKDAISNSCGDFFKDTDTTDYTQKNSTP